MVIKLVVVTMAKYSQLSYWEDRYTNDPEPFEWYQNFEGIKSVLIPVLGKFPSPSILHVGCGNSRYVVSCL